LDLDKRRRARTVSVLVHGHGPSPAARFNRIFTRIPGACLVADGVVAFGVDAVELEVETTTPTETLREVKFQRNTSDSNMGGNVRREALLVEEKTGTFESSCATQFNARIRAGAQLS